jgi:hypothetical protein
MPLSHRTTMVAGSLVWGGAILLASPDQPEPARLRIELSADDELRLYLVPYHSHGRRYFCRNDR